MIYYNYRKGNTEHYTGGKQKDDREVDDRKGKETEYHHAEELDLGGGFNRATDTGMHER